MALPAYSKLFKSRPRFLGSTNLKLAGAFVLALSFVAEHLVERPGNEFGRRLSVRLRPRRPATVPSAA